MTLLFVWRGVVLYNDKTMWFVELWLIVHDQEYERASRTKWSKREMVRNYSTVGQGSLMYEGKTVLNGVNKWVELGLTR